MNNKISLFATFSILTSVIQAMGFPEINEVAIKNITKTDLDAGSLYRANLPNGYSIICFEPNNRNSAPHCMITAPAVGGKSNAGNLDIRYLDVLKHLYEKSIGKKEVEE